MSKTVVVTGGAGFIGSHTCKLLKDTGYEVIIYDNFSTSSFSKFEEIENLICDRYRIIDLTNASALETVLKLDNPDAIVHFAAKAYVGESVNNPADYYHTNVTGTNNLIKAMNSAGTKLIVFSSSCATYGVPKNAQYINESTIQRPINPYGQTKLVCEHMLLSASTAYNIKSVSLRYFNAAGSDVTGVLGENHDPEPHLIPNVIKALINNTDINVFGDTYKTHDGTCVRDYVHVEDLATAHLKALEYLFAGNATNQFNIGTGTGHSIKEIIKIAEQITQKTTTVNMSAMRPGDPPILVGNASKAKQVLQWSPQYAVADMIKHAYNYLNKTQSRDI